MPNPHRFLSGLVLTAATQLVQAAPPVEPRGIHLVEAARYSTGIFNDGGSEISAYDAKSRRVFVTNGAAGTIDVLQLQAGQGRITGLELVQQIDLSPWGPNANSVAAHKGLVAAAVEAETITDPGTVVIFKADGTYVSAVPVGALPDMLTFTPDGKHILVANEGEPADGIDPPGSISVIDVQSALQGLGAQAVATLDFAGFDSAELRERGVRLFPGASAATDLEPEYIAVSPDGRTAMATLQEANAFAILDLAGPQPVLVDIVPAGRKDHSLEGFGLDASDRDNAISIRPWPVYGMYMPDGIASFSVQGRTYYITANEGDDRGENARVGSLKLDSTAFPNAAALQKSAALGRLNVSTIDGDPDGDLDYDYLQAYGARSVSIWDSVGGLVSDTGDLFEQVTADLYPGFFNCDNVDNVFETRSDNKGPEPEGVAVGTVLGRMIAFVGLERIGGIIALDVSRPDAPEFIEYVNSRDFGGVPSEGTAGDLAPEGLLFVPVNEAPFGEPLLIVTSEVSGSTTVYRISSASRSGK